ncbi:MAG: RagB/SusD family nutrient uptake outer membrane protein [Puia sp.]
MHKHISYLNIKSYKIILCIFFGGFVSACKKFIEIDPPSTQIIGATVYNNNNSAAAAMTSIYNNMIYGGQGLSDGLQSISCLDGLQADELTNYGNNFVYPSFYANALSSSSGGGSNNYFWPELYNEIYVCNAVIEGLNSSQAVTDSIRQQLIGEAEFMRAFFHFYATNLYGDVPVVTTTNYQTNNTIHRSPKALVYDQIVADLLDAQMKLNSDFVDYQGLTTMERTRPNRGAATALLARVYLYEQKWDSAAIQATSVINNSQYTLVNVLSNVFLANSNEAIWQLQPVTAGANTFDAQNFVLTSAPGTGQYFLSLSTFLLNSFEANDQRFSNWVGNFTDPSSNITYYFPNKYKVYLDPSPLTEYLMVLRLSEQYLIRAEAEAYGAGNGINSSISDLNVIRNRAGLPSYAGSAGQDSVVAAIMHERQIELFTEWGHRWFDLKRTGLVNSVLGSPGNVCQAKGGNWSPDWQLMPLPLSEIQINPNLTQNPGY